MYRVSIQEASSIATNILNRKVTQSNISYLIQYGVVDKIKQDDTLYLHKEQLLNYFMNLKSKELKLIIKLVKKHRQEIEKAWYEYFKK